VPLCAGIGTKATWHMPYRHRHNSALAEVKKAYKQAVSTSMGGCHGGVSRVTTGCAGEGSRDKGQNLDHG
jgi:hypothetical protein